VRDLSPLKRLPLLRDLSDNALRLPLRVQAADPGIAG
jgi:hypothetical protein